MQDNPRKLLFLICDKQGHNRVLDTVCLNSNCSSNMLVCATCIEQLHKGHEVILLSKFMETLDNLNFRKQEKPEKPGNNDDNLTKALKTAATNYKERVVELRKAFEESMAKIEDCLRYYDKAGE